MRQSSGLAPVGAALLAILAGGPAFAQSTCTDPDTTPLDPACAVEGTAVHLVRTLCDPLWVPNLCDATAFGDPGYAGTAPSPLDDGEFLTAFGIVHEHSGYSDGDPDAIPRDYFNAAKSGVNGVRVDFLMSSEHSENEKLPVTTAERCLQIAKPGVDATVSLLGGDPAPLADWLANVAAGPATIVSDALLCNQIDDTDHYFKWQATLEQAAQATDVVEGQYTGFTGIRGFEWTNDIQNHLGVYFSRNVVNAKIDGSYLDLNFFWNWLREPAAQGGGDDALVVFNHPGGKPNLTPFGDGDLPTGEVLKLLFTGNWRDLAYVPDVDANVVGMELNGGDDIEWYVKALRRGWHVGAVAAEDHHGTNWSSPDQEKTVVLTKGRSPKHYYEAMRARRTYAVQEGAYTANPTPTFPVVRFYADAPTDATSIGARMTGGGEHTLHVEIENAPVGSKVAIIARGLGLDSPISLGTINDPSFAGSASVVAPSKGEGWWFVVIHTGDVARGYQVVTAPIWIAAGS